MKKLITILVVLFGLTINYAQQRTLAEKKEECYDRFTKGGRKVARSLGNICNYVIDPEYYDGEWSYVTKFKEAAGVTGEEESEEEMYQKIREVWSKYEDCFNCYTLTLNGENVLKGAFAEAFPNKEFLLTVIKWGVNLNHIDAVDGKTVLDFLQDKMKTDSYKESFYRTYYMILKENGAKHAAEILIKK